MSDNNQPIAEGNERWEAALNQIASFMDTFNFSELEELSKGLENLLEEVAKAKLGELQAYIGTSAEECPSCGSAEIEYSGIDDGGGLWGTSICENWKCLSCGYYFEVGCQEFYAIEDYELGELGVSDADMGEVDNTGDIPF